jgi:hypothetical protein
MDFEPWQAEIEIDDLSNVRPPLLATPVGFAFGANRQLKIVLVHAASAAGGSLAQVASAGPMWRTPPAKGEATGIVGIARALRLSHWLGLLRGCLQAANILFDWG